MYAASKPDDKHENINTKVNEHAISYVASSRTKLLDLVLSFCVNKKLTLLEIPWINKRWILQERTWGK